MLAATERANIRLDEIGAELEHTALENVLAPGRCREHGGVVGDPGPVSQARGDQDADGDHAALHRAGVPAAR
jgi:hypothetical protein